MKKCLLIRVFAATPVVAQDRVYAPDATRACLADDADDATKQVCIGQSAQRCMSGNMGGDSTYGMGGCLSAELEYWDAAFVATCKQVPTEAKHNDAEMAEIGASAPNQANALRDMQHARITFRDATGDDEYSQWGGGTCGYPAIAACLMHKTSEHTLYLEQSRLGG